MNNTFTSDLSWAKRHMPRLVRAVANLPGLSSLRIACSMHLELKIIPLVEGLLHHGADLFLVTCNPTTVRDEVCAYLQERGVTVQAWKDMSPGASRDAIARALAWGPTHLCEFGADLSVAYHQALPTGIGTHVQASLEGTGSGIARLCRP